MREYTGSTERGFRKYKYKYREIELLNSVLATPLRRDGYTRQAASKCQFCTRCYCVFLWSRNDIQGNEIENDSAVVSKEQSG